MDDALKALLDRQDWVRLVAELTLAAGSLMRQYGWKVGVQDRADEVAWGYALDTMTKAYELCEGCASGRFDEARGDPLVPVERRLRTYLEHHILKRLITDDIRKAKKRSKWPIIPLDENEEVPPEQEKLAELTLIDLVCESDEELSTFISAAHQQLEDNPDRDSINWRDLQETLGITRYKCDQLRAAAKAQLQRVQSEPDP